MADVKVDISALKQLEKELDEMAEIALRRLGERGFQLLRLEIKNSAYITGNLWQGVSPPDYDFAKKTALLTVTARSARRGARQATLHLKSGETKQITLKATDPYNYAEVVALGNKSARVRAKTGKVFLIPVSSPPSGESYITSGDQIYVVRKSRKGRKPNPYHDRAAKRLQEESVKIVMGVVEDFK